MIGILPANASVTFGKNTPRSISMKESSERLSRDQLAKVDEYKALPIEDLMAGIAQFLAARRETLKKGVSEKAITVASRSGVPLYEKAQAMIEDIVAKHKTLFSSPPMLYVHTAPVAGLGNISGDKHMGAAAVLPDIIETSHNLLLEFKDTPQRLRALLAHELGHTVNGDNTLRRLAENARKRPSHENEIRANMMGAILYGNVKGFRALALEQAEGSLTHPSTKDWQRQMLDWEKQLKTIGAANADGEIIDTEKAIKACKKSSCVPNGNGNSMDIVFTSQ